MVKAQQVASWLARFRKLSDVLLPGTVLWTVLSAIYGPVFRPSGKIAALAVLAIQGGHCAQAGFANVAMGKYHLPHWLQGAVAATGGLGLFLAAFLDSSFLPLPTINDLLLIDLSIAAPARMLYYATMATLGSVAGCLILYVLARKGGQAAFHKRAGQRAPRIHRWMKRNGFVSLLIAAILPPPTPFKFFVLAAGALEMPWRQFVAALLIARGLRFYGEGFLAVHYGPQAIRFLGRHRLAFTVGLLVAIVIVYLIVRIQRRRQPSQPS